MQIPDHVSISPSWISINGNKGNTPKRLISSKVYPHSRSPVIFLPNRQCDMGESRSRRRTANSQATKKTNVGMPSRGKRSRKPSIFASDSPNFASVFLEESSVYALKQIGNSSSRARRLLWLAVVLVGLVGFVYQISQFLVSYYSYPVVVNIYSVRPPLLEFPAVTFCNINPVRKEFWSCVEARLDYSQCLASNRTQVATEAVVSPEEPVCVEAQQFFGQPVDLRDANFYQVVLLGQEYENRAMYGHQAHDFIWSCNYNGFKCDTAMFKQSFSWSYGNCYTLNISAVHRPRVEAYYAVGPGAGLEVILNLETEKYAWFTEEVGARVHIHHFHQPHDIDRQGVNLLPGFKTSIGISKRLSERLPPPFPDSCFDYEINDSEFLCRQRCEEAALQARCGCSLNGNLDRGLRACAVVDPRVYCCVVAAFRWSSDNCQCPAACLEVFYNVQISSTAWPSEAKFINDIEPKIETTNITLEDFRKKLLKVKVFYDSADYTTTKQSPLFHDSEILSLIGGQMGLWLGLSLITTFEFVEKIFLFIKYKICG